VARSFKNRGKKKRKRGKIIKNRETKVGKTPKVLRKQKENPHDGGRSVFG
jgi:hypothetical protein